MQNNAEKNAHLKPKQRAAIVALLSEKTKRDAAQAAGISERQLYTWLQNPIFNAALAEAEADARGQIRRQITNRAAAIADVMAEIMENPDVTPAVRLQAAAKLGDLFIKTTDDADIIRRITALEVVQYAKE